MTELTYLFGVVAVLAGAVSSISIWAPRRLAMKLLAVAGVTLFLPAAYAGFAQLLALPKPVALEWWQARTEEATVLAASLREDEAIYLWLQLKDVSEPRAYELPWHLSFAAPPAKGSGHVGSGRFIIRDGSLSSAAGQSRAVLDGIGRGPAQTLLPSDPGRRESRASGRAGGRCAGDVRSSRCRRCSRSDARPKSRSDARPRRRTMPDVRSIRAWPVSAVAVGLPPVHLCRWLVEVLRRHLRLRRGVEFRLPVVQGVLERQAHLHLALISSASRWAACSCSARSRCHGNS
jgi:hypothetical protein